MLTILAPAKINLTLEVLAERQDALHEIRSVIQTIKIYDRLDFKLGNKILIRCDNDNWLAEKSLVSKAVALLKEKTGYTGGATIEVSKKIPLLSGLGGDSSDAAAVLHGLNRLWDLTITPGELATMGSQLGSDVPFFHFGGTALLQGRGELVIPLPSVPHIWIVLLIPPLPLSGGKTGRLYARVNISHHTEGQMTEKLVSLLTRGGDVRPNNLYNVFENVAYDAFEKLDYYRQKFLEADAIRVHLAGSGPALFTIAKEKTQAEKIYKSLKKQGLETYMTETLDSVESIR